MILDETINAKDAWLKQVKHHRRRLKGLPRVGFNPNAGNVEHNISMMNKMLGSGEMISNNPISGPFGGDASAPAGGTSMGESFDNKNKNNSRGFDMVEEIRHYVLELVQAEFETGHLLSDDYNTFKKLVADDGYRATKSMYEFYLECRELGPAGFLSEYRDELDFDSMFILEYGDEEELEGEEENIEESLTEKTNMEKLRALYPELAESYDKEGNPERCKECNTLLNDAGECPKCVHGEEDIDESLTEATLNEGPFDRLKKKMDKADKKANKAVDKMADPKNIAKILFSTYNDTANTYFIDNEWKPAKEIQADLKQVIQTLGTYDTNVTQIDPDKNSDLVKFVDAVVKNKDGYIIRRGLELIKPGTLEFNPTRRDLMRVKDGYRAEDVIGVRYSGNNKTKNDNTNPEDVKKEDPASEREAKGETSNPQVDTNKDPADAAEKKETPDKVAAPKGITDKTIQRTISAAKVFGMNIYAMKNGDVKLLNDTELKQLKSHSDMNEIWVGRDNKNIVTLAQLAAELKKKNIVESLDDEMVYGEIDIEDTDLEEGLNKEEMQELINLGKSIGLNTLGDVQEFAKREAAPGESMLDALRRYRDDLGGDFVVREDFNVSPEAEFEDSDNMEDISWFNV